MPTRIGGRESGHTQIARGASDHFSLLLGGPDKLEPVLEAVAVADLGFDFQWLCCFRKLQLQFDNFSNINFAGDGCAQPAFGNVLCPSDECFFCPDDDAQIQKITRMRSRKGPRMLFILGHSC
jgi:hypothetical protein